VLVLVFAKRRLYRLVQEWQVDIDQVDQLVAKEAFLLGCIPDPLGDTSADPLRTPRCACTERLCAFGSMSVSLLPPGG
jgi:hypothetical protein